MSKIKFGNGDEYDCPYLATIPDGTAFIALSDVTFVEAATIFSDETMTGEMEYGDYTLVGYTNLGMLTAQPYGIQALLKGGHDERRE